MLPFRKKVTEDEMQIVRNLVYAVVLQRGLRSGRELLIRRRMEVLGGPRIWSKKSSSHLMTVKENKRSSLRKW